MWIIMTWQRNSPEVTVKGFKKCCTCNAMNETDGDMLLNGSEEERNIRSECETDEGPDYEDGDSNTVW
jgi:hypothetical protein